VRWEQLFADLDAQFEAAQQQDLEGEIADRTRRELARTSLLDRLRAATGDRLPVSVVGVGALTLVVRRVGFDWVLFERPGGAATVVPAAGLASVGGLGRATEPLPDEVGRGLDLRFLLRGLARDRAPVRLALRDGGSLAGTIDRVGADYLDLAEHPAEEPRRPAAVVGVRTVAISALAAVHLG
jgi:hypothetical protein